MELFINTVKNDNTDIEIRLTDGDDILVKKTVNAHLHQAEKLLPFIESVLKEKERDVREIKQVKVVSGGGSFSALRIGIITANALGYALSIPVLTDINERHQGISGEYGRKFDIVKPVYEKEPNITKSKRR